MPYRLGFINLAVAKTGEIHPNIHKMIAILGTCGIPLIFISEAPKETITRLREMDITRYLEPILLGVDDQARTITDKLAQSWKKLPRKDVFYLSDRLINVKRMKNIGIGAVYFNKNSAPMVTSALRVNI